MAGNIISYIAERNKFETTPRYLQLYNIFEKYDDFYELDFIYAVAQMYKIFTC
jgi:hypothetical protein